MEKEAQTPSARVASAYAVHEQLVTALAVPALSDRVQEYRREREARTGECDSEDEGFEARMLAFWDAAVTARPLLEVMAPAARQRVGDWIEPFCRAHRGLFRVGPGFALVDRWSGAEFQLTPKPPPELALALESAEGLIDGRLVGRTDPLTIALLPGAFFHPADATQAIESVLNAARADGFGRDDVLDALLRMEARLRAHSRVKPSYAYRASDLKRT